MSNSKFRPEQSQDVWYAPNLPLRFFATYGLRLNSRLLSAAHHLKPRSPLRTLKETSTLQLWDITKDALNPRESCLFAPNLELDKPVAERFQ